MATTVSLNCAFPSPKDATRNVLNTVSTYRRKGLEQACRYKYVALIVAAVIAGGVLVYESEFIKEKIKKLLGFKTKIDKRMGPMSRDSHLPKDLEEQGVA